MIRFRTRLNLTVIVLIVLAVTGMSVVMVSMFATRTGALYYNVGLQLNQLVERNIEYGLDLPGKVMDQVADQMVVQALLVSELVSLANQGRDARQTDAGALIERVRERSKAVRGYPLLDEVWVTDAQGKSVLRPANAPPMDFVEASKENAQTRPFLRLLEEQEASPVIERQQPRALDDKPFRYVGVGGVDQPRIVQVGTGETLSKVITADFDIQKTVERFMTGMNFERIVVMDATGKVLAAAGAPQTPGQGLVDDKVRRFCMDFLQSKSQFESELFGKDIGVVTMLQPVGSQTPMALFVEHQTRLGLLMIYQYVISIAVVGLAAIGLGAVASMVLSRGLSQPLEALTKGAKALGEGNLDYRITLTRNDEFKRLAQAFNHMAASLRKHVSDLKTQAADRERLESELRIASDVQQMLLPVAPPKVAGYQMAGLCLTAKTVGGDFFDYVPMTDGALGVVLGDATGKGMPAALLTTQCWSTLRTLASAFQDPAELLRRTNRELNRRLGPSYRFVTLFCCRVEPLSPIIRYAVAGHNPPLLVAPGGTAVNRIDCPPAYPLGMNADTLYPECSMALPPGAMLCIYSDGLVDARNGQGDLFGEERLSALLMEDARLAPDAIAERIAAAVRVFCESDDLFDDLTVVIIQHWDTDASLSGQPSVLANVP